MIVRSHPVRKDRGQGWATAQSKNSRSRIPRLKSPSMLCGRSSTSCTLKARSSRPPSRRKLEDQGGESGSDGWNLLRSRQVMRAGLLVSPFLPDMPNRTPACFVDRFHAEIAEPITRHFLSITTTTGHGRPATAGERQRWHQRKQAPLHLASFLHKRLRRRQSLPRRRARPIRLRLRAGSLRHSRSA